MEPGKKNDWAKIKSKILIINESKANKLFNENKINQEIILIIMLKIYPTDKNMLI